MMNGSNVIDIPRRYVRFYAKHIECNFCGELSRGRIYDSMQMVVCGSCGGVWWTFEHSDEWHEEMWDG